MKSESKIDLNTPYSEVLAMEGGTKEAYKVLPWDLRIIIESTSSAEEIFDQMGNQNLPEYPPPPPSDTVAQILTAMYELDRKELQQWQSIGNTPQLGLAIMRERNVLYQQIAHEIKKNQRFYFLEDMVNRTHNPELQKEVKDLLVNDISAIHLLVGREDRLLVGLKGGVFWKKIEWPDDTNHTRTSAFYLAMAPQIGRREMEILPGKPLTPEVLEDMRVPVPIQTVEEALEQAYYGQRYIVPSEGAEVRFRKAGDLDKVTILQSRNMFFGKITTDKGEVLTAIDLENGDVWSDLKDKPFGGILAEVYRDIVTAVELHANRSHRLKNLQFSSKDEDDIAESLQVTYIPRILRIKDGEDFRSPYKGPSRPSAPHRVTGHRRHVSMSEKHRQELLKFEHETGISILENLPIGYTFVRPHVVPNDSNIQGLPVFIKKRIETQLKQDLQRSIEEINQDEPEVQDIELEEGQEVKLSKRRFHFRLPQFRGN